MDDSKPDDYAIGHKRPPKEYQFKKGQKKPVGSGRRKHAKNSRTIIDQMLNEIVTVPLNGAAQSVSKKELLIRVSFEKAIKAPSINQSLALIRMFEKLAPESMDPPLPLLIESMPGDGNLAA